MMAMAHFDKMVDLRHTADDKAASNMPLLGDDRNHSMCITLYGPELDKLDRDADLEEGTMLHFCCMGIVRDVHKSTAHPGSICIEIAHMAVENESEEEQNDLSSNG